MENSTHILGIVMITGKVQAVADSSAETAASHARRLGKLFDRGHFAKWVILLR